MVFIHLRTTLEGFAAEVCTAAVFGGTAGGRFAGAF
jgi:hypothetical protein